MFIPVPEYLRRSCEHKKCANFWDKYLVKCYARSNRRLVCLDQTRNNLWILVPRRVHLVNTNVAPHHFRYKRGEDDETVAGSAYSSVSPIDALTADYGTELWLGRFCKEHYSTKNRRYFQCAYLIHPLGPRILWLMAKWMLISTLYTYDTFLSEKLFRYITRKIGKCDTHESQALRNAATREMGQFDPESFHWKLLNAVRMFADMPHGKSLGTLSGSRPFFAAMKTLEAPTVRKLKKMGHMFADPIFRRSLRSKLDKDLLVLIRRYNRHWRTPSASTSVVLGQPTSAAHEPNSSEPAPALPDPTPVCDPG